MKIISVAVVSIAAMCVSVNAQVSQWQNDQWGKMRLVAVQDEVTKKIQAGLQVNMKKGWKTYWKNPGAAGIPPIIKWDKSQNVSEAKLSLPTPQLFEDESIGYKNNVVFVVDVVPEEENQKSVVSAEGVIGICEIVCIPVVVDVTLEIDPNDGNQNVGEIIREAKSKLPNEPRETQKVTKAEYDAGMNKIIVEVVVPQKAENISLFADNPKGWLIGYGEITNQKDNKAEFEMEVYQKLEEETEIQYMLVVDGNGTQQVVKTK